MGLLDKAKQRKKQVKAKSTVRPATAKKTPKRKTGPSRGLLHRASHRKKEIEVKTSTKFSRELKGHKIETPKAAVKKGEEKVVELSSTGPLYSTIIDKIYHQVKASKSISLKKIMKLFNLDRDIVEQWANILDEEKLLELYYPVTGDPILRLPEADVSKKTKAKSDEKEVEKKAGKKTPVKIDKKKSVKIAVVSVVFASFVIVTALYILSPNLLEPLTNLLAPVIGIFKYIFGQLSLLIGS